MKNENKIIWFKKPKCAGTSFEEFLRSEGAIYYYDNQSTLAEMEREEYKVICVRTGVSRDSTTWKKTSKGNYKRKSTSGFLMRLYIRLFSKPFDASYHFIDNYPELVKKYHSFAIIRNPFDKFVSSWRYVKSTREHSATEVLNNLPDKNNYHDWLHLTKQQVLCVSDTQNNIVVDRFVYMEHNFEHSLEVLMKMVGINNFKLPHKNKAKRKSIAEELNVEELKSIFNLYKDDFKVFGYSADPDILAPINPTQEVIDE